MFREPDIGELADSERIPTGLQVFCGANFSLRYCAGIGFTLSLALAFIVQIQVRDRPRSYEVMGAVSQAVDLHRHGNRIFVNNWRM